MTEHLTNFLLKNELLPESDIQHLMNWSDSTLEARRARGQMPAYISKGKIRLYRYADVMEWLADGERLKPYQQKNPRTDRTVASILE